MMIPAEGIENRTGTICLRAWVGSRTSPRLEVFGGPDYLPVNSLAFSLSVVCACWVSSRDSDAFEPMNMAILLQNITLDVVTVKNLTTM